TTRRSAPPTWASDAARSVAPLQPEAGAQLARVAERRADVVAVQAHRRRGAAREVPAEADTIGEATVAAGEGGQRGRRAVQRRAHTAIHAQVGNDAGTADEA